MDSIAIDAVMIQQRRNTHPSSRRFFHGASECPLDTLRIHTILTDAAGTPASLSHEIFFRNCSASTLRVCLVCFRSKSTYAPITNCRISGKRWRTGGQC